MLKSEIIDEKVLEIIRTQFFYGKTAYIFTHQIKKGANVILKKWHMKVGHQCLQNSLNRLSAKKLIWRTQKGIWIYSVQKKDTNGFVYRGGIV